MADQNASLLVKSAWKIIPHFHCADVMRSVDFYTTKLHFWLGGINPDSSEEGSPEPTMCSVAIGKRADANIYIFKAPAAELRPSTAMIALGTEELDQYYNLLVREKQVEIMDAIDDKPWGYRQFQIKDPDGNQIQFFKFLEGGNPGSGE